MTYCGNCKNRSSILW